MPNLISLPLDLLLLESSIQPREGVTQSTVNDYAALYADGHELAPIMVYQDGIDYWVADGFHRVAAARQAGLSGIAAEVRQGSKRDALLYAAGANKHGKPMSNEDKRRVVMRMLDDAEWSGWTNTEIARHCGVSEHLVRSLRLGRSEPVPAERFYRTRNGTVATMQTANIGKRAVPPLHSLNSPMGVILLYRNSHSRRQRGTDIITAYGVLGLVSMCIGYGNSNSPGLGALCGCHTVPACVQ